MIRRKWGLADESDQKSNQSEYEAVVTLQLPPAKQRLNQSVILPSAVKDSIIDNEEIDQQSDMFGRRSIGSLCLIENQMDVGCQTSARNKFESSAVQPHNFESNRVAGFQGNQVYASYNIQKAHETAQPIDDFSKEHDIKATEAVINYDAELDQEVDDINERVIEEDLLMGQ